MLSVESIRAVTTMVRRVLEGNIPPTFQAVSDTAVSTIIVPEAANRNPYLEAPFTELHDTVEFGATLVAGVVFDG